MNLRLKVISIGIVGLFSSLAGAVQLIDPPSTPKVTNITVFVGLPIRYSGNLYNVSACISDKKLMAFIPKQHLANDLGMAMADPPFPSFPPLMFQKVKWANASL